MRESTRVRLDAAYALCQAEDRSAEYTIQFLQDYALVDFDYVIYYLQDISEIKEAKE